MNILFTSSISISDVKHIFMIFLQGPDITLNS